MAARILIIEDDPASLELLIYLLSRAGYAVTSAVNGKEGLDSALRNEHDLVLCDLQLPKISGFEIVQKLFADPAWLRVPVVAVTAYSMPGDRDTAIAAGFTDYLTKPIDPEIFVQEVARLLPAKLPSG